MTRRSVRRLLGFVALVATLTTFRAPGLQAQIAEATHWRAAGLYARAFGGDGWGGLVGVTHGLFSGPMLVGGLGIDAAWYRPRLSGDRAPGVPPRRDVVALDVHLRTRLLRGPISVELGLPVGFVRSAVGRASDSDAVEPGPHRYNEPGADVGATAGLLAGVRASVWSSLSIVAEYEVVRAWIYEGRHWLETFSVGFQARLR